MRIELERPSEWLRQLEEEPEGYRALLAEAGGLARAAYRLAAARCRAEGGGSRAPTLRELRVGALAIAARLNITDTLPITSLLASDCEDQGLQVLRPTPTPPSRAKSSAPPLRRAS